MLDGRDLAKVFAWMRPNDLIWNYWVNNYLLGNAPPAFDILYWNSDTTSLPARLHSDYLDLINTNPFRNPGALTISGTPVDMGKVKLDAYVAAGSTDHITPWKSVYQTARILGEETTFVLSNAGHLQSLLNPPGKSQGDIRDRAGELARPGGVRGQRGQAVGKLVDALEPMAVNPLGRQGRGAERLGQRGVSAGPTGARNLCVQCVKANARSESVLHERNELVRNDGRTMNARMVRVEGQDLWVSVKSGAKDRPPLLLFNGIGANVELAEPFMREMGDVETVVFDIPGVGGSPLPKLPYRPSTVARWAAGLIRQLGYDRIDVAGVSWGGGIAQQFAHQYPQVCRRLILAATAPGVIMVPGKLSVLWKMASPRRYIDPDYLRSIAAEIYGGNLREDPSLIHEHAENMKGASNLGYLYQLLALAGWTSLLWLHSLKQPTLVVMGHDDPIVPMANGQILARLIPNSRLEVMACGHLFIVTMPRETAKLFRQFVGEA